MSDHDGVDGVLGREFGIADAIFKVALYNPLCGMTKGMAAGMKRLQTFQCLLQSR